MGFLTDIVVDQFNILMQVYFGGTALLDKLLAAIRDPSESE